MAVQVCTELSLPLIVVGSGALLAELKNIAGPTVRFAGAVSDQELSEIYSGARALLYPVEDEDFGIVPVEAQQAGVPVIAHASGGPLETVIDGVTGVLFTELTPAGLKSALKQFIKHERDFNSQIITQHAASFSAETFRQNLLDFLSKL